MKNLTLALTICLFASTAHTATLSREAQLHMCNSVHSAALNTMKARNTTPKREVIRAVVNSVTVEEMQMLKRITSVDILDVIDKAYLTSTRGSDRAIRQRNIRFADGVEDKCLKYIAKM